MPWVRIAPSCRLACVAHAQGSAGVRPPSHQRAMCIFRPRSLVNSRAQDSHLCTRLSFATSASVVALVRVVLWMCITLLFLAEIIIAASAMEPAASDVTRAVACPASSSMRAASSAYSNLAIWMVCAPVPTVLPGFTWSYSLKIRSSPAMKHTGEKISPCSTPLSMLKGPDIATPPSCCLMRTTPVQRKVIPQQRTPDRKMVHPPQSKPDGWHAQSQHGAEAVMCCLHSPSATTTHEQCHLSSQRQSGSVSESESETLYLAHWPT